VRGDIDEFIDHHYLKFLFIAIEEHARTQQRTECGFRCFVRVSNSCSTSGIRRVTVTHQYHLSPQIIVLKKKTTTYDVGNPGSGLGHAKNSCGVKPVNWIPILPLFMII
jgi:hypothetical protein